MSEITWQKRKYSAIDFLKEKAIEVCRWRQQLASIKGIKARELNKIDSALLGAESRLEGLAESLESASPDRVIFSEEL